MGYFTVPLLAAALLLAHLSVASSSLCTNQCDATQTVRPPSTLSCLVVLVLSCILQGGNLITFCGTDGNTYTTHQGATQALNYVNSDCYSVCVCRYVMERKSESTRMLFLVLLLFCIVCMGIPPLFLARMAGRATLQVKIPANRIFKKVKTKTKKRQKKKAKKEGGVSRPPRSQRVSRRRDARSKWDVWGFALEFDGPSLPPSFPFPPSSARYTHTVSLTHIPSHP